MFTDVITMSRLRRKAGFGVALMAAAMLLTFPFLPPSTAGLLNLGFVIASTILGHRRWGLIATGFTLIITWVMDILFWQEGFPPSVYIVGGAINAAISLSFGTLLKERAERLLHDGLTGTFNRDAFEELLAWEIGISLRYERDLALLMIDLDNFKPFNDHHGHMFGDQVLRQFAQLLKQACRSADRVARYGGDEFVIILPETGYSGAECIGRRVCRLVEDARWGKEGDQLVLTVSIGGVLLRPGMDRDALVSTADKALYQAKRVEGNAVVIHSGSADRLVVSPG